jgi:hypothetical protein
MYGDVAAPYEGMDRPRIIMDWRTQMQLTYAELEVILGLPAHRLGSWQRRDNAPIWLDYVIAWSRLYGLVDPFPDGVPAAFFMRGGVAPVD